MNATNDRGKRIYRQQLEWMALMNKATVRAHLVRFLIAFMVLVSLLSTTAADWPSYGHDAQRTGVSDDTILSPANASQLTVRWKFKTGDKIASSPTVVNGVAYVGSWDGYEYALNTADGSLKWKAFLGITGPLTGCNPTTAGISSVATVQNGVVYVGGGDAYWYALDASTGAVLWKVYTGDNSASGGHYNWASPLIANGYAYIGISSFGDCPLVPGQLLQVSLTTHQIVNTATFVPSGQSGAGIWTSPTLDASGQTVFVTTGTATNDVTQQPYAQAMVALDAGTLAIKGGWRIPPAQAVPDSDWGTTPNVFPDGHGTNLVAGADKNGYLYAYDQANISAGPLWQDKVGDGGSSPQYGTSMISTGAFGNGQLYFASGVVTVNGTKYGGSVSALDPFTGAYKWRHYTPSAIVPALAYVNGLVIAGSGSTLDVLNASTGAQLYQYTTGGQLYGHPSVANGQIFEGSTDGYVYAFAPASPRPSTPVDLRAAYNNVGISDDATPGAANFDGGGYSYSAQALQAAGITAGSNVVVNGVTFQWPAAPSGTADNVAAQGQTIRLGTPTGGTTLAVLGAANSGPSSGTGTITYSDGSTQSFSLGFSDWTLNGGAAQPLPGNSPAASMPYRNGSAGKQTLQTDVFYTDVALQAGKAVASVTLPAAPTQGGLHVFAMTVAGSASSPLPTSTSTRTPVPTSTSTSTSTNTPLATATNTSTNTPLATATNTSTPPPLPASTSTSTPPPLPASTSTSTPVAGTASGSISLSSTTNNAGISADSAPGAANFDGYGYSYSAQALQAAGFSQGQSVTVNGVAFQWPPAAPGTPDNVLAQGQTVSLATPTAGTTLAVLGAASNGPSTGTGTITYSDGSTQSFSLGFSDWTLNGGAAQPLPGNTVAATLSYRNNGGGKQVTQTHVFYTAITLQAGKAVASVTLPTLVTQGHLHVFAMTVSGAASPPAATSTSTRTPPALPASTSTNTPPATSTSANTPPATSTSTNTPLATSTSTSTNTPLATSTSTPPATSTPATTALFATGFESGDSQPTWANTVDTTGGGGGILNVGGICCGLSGPEAGVRTETTHTGSSALMYSGMDNSATSSYAYLKVFDLGTRHIVVGPTTALSYWIYPQSHTANGLVSGGNSSCVAVDLVFTDGATLHTLGAVDQAGNPLTPSAQCGHLTLDTWNHITSTIGTVTSGKTISRLDVGYDQPANTGGYRGYIDDISIHN